MKWILFALLSGFVFTFFSCEETQDLFDTGLTNQEIISGLKQALDTSVDSAVTSGSAVDGYLKNEAIKVLLPQEVKDLQTEIATGSVSGLVSYQTILDAYVALTPDIEADPFEELVTAMNRGAESAATKATPIFVNAITQMSITDALGILQGGERAATDYFQANTSTALISAFQPDIKNALGDSKATDIYVGIVGFLNYEYVIENPLQNITIAVNDYVGQGLNLPETLDAYATEKAVDGLFYLLGEEEKKIRKDPLGYASDIIQRVFGSDEAKGI